MPSLIPGVMFKYDHKGQFGKNPFRFRIAETQAADEVCQKEHLDLLHTPQQQIIKLELEEGCEIEILAEEKFDLAPGYDAQKALFDFCCQDPELRPFIVEVAIQLTILIITTDFADVKYDNIPFLMNGPGIGLIDMEIPQFPASPLCGLFKGYGKQTEGLLNYLTPDLLDEVIPTLEKRLTPEQLKEIDLPKIKEQRKLALQQTQMISLFQKNVTECPFVKQRETDETMKKIQRTVHKSILEEPPLGLSLRKFYIPEWHHSSKTMLEGLKQAKTIGDHECEPSGGGWFYIYC